VRGLGAQYRILVARNDVSDGTAQWEYLLRSAQAHFEHRSREHCSDVHRSHLRTRRKGAAQPVQPFCVHSRRHPGTPGRDRRA
jgi:hypothetical protein